jgi:phage terminase large subunit GpA-like protein
MQHRPSPILMVLPTASAAQSYAKERLADAIRSTPVLRALVSDKRVPSSEGLPESTIALRFFPGGFLALAGGNSVNNFARLSVRVAIADDCDRIPRFVGVEGDPTQLLINRTTSFHDGLTIFVSTPVLAGGRIETLYAQSDRRRFFLPCVACGRWDWVTWGDAAHWSVKFDDRQPATARLACPCGHEVHEPERMDLVRAGEWRATAEPLSPGYVGFSLPAMYSPFVTLSGLVTRFLSAHVSGPRRLREFVTTQLAEGWKDDASSMDPNDLVSRMEDF